MDVTELRSHWVSRDGKRHASRLTRSEDGRVVGIRHDLQPIVNVDELRAYADLGDQLLPGVAFPANDSARRVSSGEDRDPHVVRMVVAELTDHVPVYHPRWRQSFIDLRNRWPGCDGLPITAVG